MLDGSLYIIPSGTAAELLFPFFFLYLVPLGDNLGQNSHSVVVVSQAACGKISHDPIALMMIPAYGW
jgi:hypothetical protein